MPIPTRSMSVREPRQQSQTTPGVSRIATKTTPTTTADNAPTRRSSTLLPPRSSREDPVSPSAMKSQTPSQESRLRLPRGNPVAATATATSTPTTTHRRGPSQQDDEKRPSPSANSSSSSSSGGTIARRQSLIKPSPLKTSSTTSTTGSSGIATPAGRNTATSPRKRELPRPQTSPRKIDNGRTEMGAPALPRHGRSVSLRQPPEMTPMASPGVGGSATIGRTHVRHRSQGIAGVAMGDGKTSTPVKKGEGEGTPRGKVPFAAQFSPKKAVGSRLAGTGAGAGAGAGAGTAVVDPSLMPSSWPEIAVLQIELLHLHLYHSSSLQQHHEWQTESEAQLRKKYDSVAQTYHTIVNDEQHRQRCLNGQALSTWLGNIEPTASSNPDQIAHFSQIIQDISDLTDPVTGQYTHVLQTFDAWFHKADEIRKCRRQLDADAASGLLVFIDPLDDRGWRDDLEALSLNIEHCARQLQSLDILGHLGDLHGTGADTGTEQSALVRTVRGLDELLQGLTKEIATVKRVEKDIVRSERVWVTKITEQFSIDDSSSGLSRRKEQSGGALWRSAVHS